MTIRIIGDVHGLVSRTREDGFTLAPEAKGRTYLSIAKDSEYSIQLGDVGWRENLIDVRNDTLPDDKHKIILGNHDDYDNPVSKSLGDYGVSELNGIQFGFIRGELSVDKDSRIWDYPNKSWWEQEELTASQMIACMKYFDVEKPRLMLSHGLPHILFGYGLITNKWKLNPSMTSQLLSSVYQSSRPALWIGGHHHKNWVYKHEGTTFVCLSELCYVDLSIVDGKYVLKGDINLEVGFRQGKQE